MVHIFTPLFWMVRVFITPLYFLSGHQHFFLFFVDRTSRHRFLLMTNLMHFFMYLFTHFISLHVFEHQVLIIRRSNFINTSSGMISLCR